MRHRVKKVKLGSDKDHTRSMLRNLAMSVIIYEKIRTTEKRAKAVAPLVDKLINIAKKKEKKDAIREIERLLQHENSSKKIMEELVKRYKDRPSGYTRIIPIKYRAGDAARVCQIELV